MLIDLMGVRLCPNQDDWSKLSAPNYSGNTKEVETSKAYLQVKEVANGIEIFIPSATQT